MRQYLRSAALALLGSATIAGLGCNQEVDREDVSDARQDVMEEERETQEARNEMNQEIAEQRREATAERHEVLKPDMEGVRDEARDVDEARQEGAEAVREEEKETQEAREELNETQAKLQAQQARDKFLADPLALLKTAEQRIEQMKNTAEGQEGAAQEATQLQIDEMQVAHDGLEEAIDEAQSADALDWQTEKATVETAHKNLQNELNEAKPDVVPEETPETAPETTPEANE